ncbi:hypothetical protein [Actinomyces massiliensis]|uniref:hypothetical protein n=1 Tax=Actinomyces massiliensis TaxID=461393 RepID=UPI0028EAB9F1|nr:hypothetical protein [Actinomyces massiliensis]
MVGLARQPHRHRSTAPAPQRCRSIIENCWKCWRRWAGSAGTIGAAGLEALGWNRWNHLNIIEIDILERDRLPRTRSTVTPSISFEEVDLDASPLPGVGANRQR